MRKITILLLLLLPIVASGQQNHTLYQMHYIGQSNFLNPAVQSECKWFIGLPLLSSLHLNYGNSAFSYKSIVNATGPSSVEFQIDEAVNRMGRRTLIGTELHLAILALGYKRNDYYFNFSINEKINIPFTLSKDLFLLGWEGNTQFLDERASSRGSAIYASHYREYALGVSKRTAYGNYWGLKGKLLFGKAYLGTPEADFSLFTDSSSYNLTMSANLKANMSAPISVHRATNMDYQFDIIDNFSIYQYLLNRKNWGFALDAGFIRQLNGRTSLSGSIVDLGFVGWRSNPSNALLDAEFTYEGVLADSVNLIGAFADSLNLVVTNDNFYTMLPLKLYLGVDYALHEKLAARALTSAVIYRTKFLSALTLSLDYNPFGNFHVVGSYSLMYRAYNNIGLGISIGRGPVQFYAISDNVAGMIWPLSARNLNLRFGLNINLGCKSNDRERPSGLSSPGYIQCPAYMKALDRQKRRR